MSLFDKVSAMFDLEERQLLKKLDTIIAARKAMEAYFNRPEQGTKVVPKRQPSARMLRRVTSKQIRELRKEGKTHNEIAEALNITLYRVGQAIGNDGHRPHRVKVKTDEQQQPLPLSS